MSNKYLIQDKSLLLRNKLDRITKTLQAASSAGNASFQTQEDYTDAANKALGEFFKSLNDPIFDPQTVHPNDLPSIEDYNLIWEAILDDLVILFSELQNIESLTLSNFNFITTESNRLLARLKNVSSKLGDYILYTNNPTKDSFFYKDSFNDLSKVEVKSALLNTDECNVNQDEGIVTLPIDQTATTTIQVKQLPVINSNSNGVVGNNQQLNVPQNGSISVILDSDPSTWFEYENVVTFAEDTKEPLILDLTMNIGDAQIINFIRVNPNNFGTKTIILIDDIETSLDGKVYTSIKHDIPVGDFISEDQQSLFTLSPSTSKYAGQGIYTFSPRKAKYIHFVFRQTEPFIIETPTGQKLRYAIGLRDIEIKSLVFLSAGELISKSFQTIDEIRKVLLNTNQNPTQKSELASIKYSVSPNDGISWNEIEPKNFEGLQDSAKAVVVPSILSFNGPETTSINTPVAVRSLRLKLELARNDDAFSAGSSTLQKTVLPHSELHKIPAESPFSFALDLPPVLGSVEVIDPLFGSRGLPDFAYIVGHGRGGQFNTQSFSLPFTELPRPHQKVLTSGTFHIDSVPASSWLHVVVGGEEWTQATAPLSTYTANGSVAAQFRLYNFDVATGALTFGNGLNTMRPPVDSPIGVYFDAERLFPSEAANTHVAQLEFKTGNNRNAFTIKRYDEAQTVTEIVSRKATILRLQNGNVTDTSGVAAALNALGFTTLVAYLNGHDELVNNTCWSIDIKNGIIYIPQPTPATRDVSISYSYQPIFTLSTDDWDWASTDTLRDSVVIRDTAWQTIAVANESLPTLSGIQVLDLAHLSVVKGTFVPALVGTSPAITPVNNPFLKEVNFVDGVTELGNPVKSTSELIPTLTMFTFTSFGIAQFSLSENISPNSTYIVKFSDPLGMFINSVVSFAALTSPGDYFIQRDSTQGDYGTVYVIAPTLATVIGAGTISYFYQDPNFKDAGLFAVDYSLGRVYLQRPLLAGDWSLTAGYQYTNFQAEYKIARVLDPLYYDIDVQNKTIVIKDEEILTINVLPRASLQSDTIYYQVNYDYVQETREDIADLKNYFSPLVKDYALKILTKSNIF